MKVEDFTQTHICSICRENNGDSLFAVSYKDIRHLCFTCQRKIGADMEMNPDDIYVLVHMDGYTVRINQKTGDEIIEEHTDNHTDLAIKNINQLLGINDHSGCDECDNDDDEEELV